MTRRRHLTFVAPFWWKARRPQLKVWIEGKKGSSQALSRLWGRTDRSRGAPEFHPWPRSVLCAPPSPTSKRPLRGASVRFLGHAPRPRGLCRRSPRPLDSAVWAALIVCGAVAGLVVGTAIDPTDPHLFIVHPHSGGGGLSQPLERSKHPNPRRGSSGVDGGSHSSKRQEREQQAATAGAAARMSDRGGRGGCVLVGSGGGGFRVGRDGV